ncbi:MAG: hypothetical protein ACLR6O_03350 [Eubacterium sp.]
MKSIIVAYPVKQTALQIKNVLESEGLYVSHICGTGASVLNIAADMRGGVIVCASILRDMGAGTIAERLPAGLTLLLFQKAVAKAIWAISSACRFRSTVMNSFPSFPFLFQAKARLQTEKRTTPITYQTQRLCSWRSIQ